MFRRACLLALIIGNSLLGVPRVATAAGWRAGVAKVNISPELPIWLSGYATRNRPAATKHDDLWANIDGVVPYAACVFVARIAGKDDFALKGGCEFAGSRNH